MRSKKSVGLSMSMIVMAIIALAVLFIIIAIFTNVTEKTAKNLGGCTSKGGDCLPPNGCPETKPIRLIVSGDCESQNNVCCFPAK